jgi:hypothetical protein
MGSPAGETRFAFSANRIYFSYDPLPLQVGLVYCLDHFSDEFMAGDTCIRIIAPDELQIGTADPGYTHSY